MDLMTRCPSCQVSFNVAAGLLNKWVHCASCQARFQVREVQPEVAAPSPPPESQPTDVRMPEYQTPAVNYPAESGQEPQPSGKGSGWVVSLVIFIILAVIRGLASSSSSPPAHQFQPTRLPQGETEHAKLLRELQQQFGKPQEEKEKDPQGQSLKRLALTHPERVAILLATPHAMFARSALLQEGVVVEPALHPSLKHESENVRILACEILEEKGTQLSLDPLAQTARADVSEKVRLAASKAQKQIEERIKDAFR